MSEKNLSFITMMSTLPKSENIKVYKLRRLRTRILEDKDHARQKYGCLLVGLH